MGILSCCSILVVLVALLAGGVFQLVQNPANAKAAIHKFVEMAEIPKEIFNEFEVLDETVWVDMLTKLHLGIAEGYMHEKIKMDPKRFLRVLLNGTILGSRRKEDASPLLDYIVKAINAPQALQAYFTNQQSRERSTRVTKQHYDAGNDLYEVMLGPSMSYTCAYFKDAANLDQAQTNKFNLIMRKLELSPGMKVADFGMGWGTAAAYMHENGKVDVTGLSLSEQQVKWASEHLTKPGLRFIWQDYRDHCENPKNAGTYDRIYSIGMLEHIGFHNFNNFFKCIKTLLKPDGLAVVHSIGEPDFVPMSDAFLDKYIFPGAVIPAMSTLMPAIESNFILEDWQNFGHDYSKTLEAWNVNAKKFFADNPKAYTPEFQRMWEYYLVMCEVLFELRINQLWHFVLSPRPAYRERIARQL